jgi:nucleotidyltransferase substrate binding protein (TIGR01987 family)
MDLALKFLQRYLKMHLQIDESVIRSKKDLFREAARLKIIDDAESWIAHYEARNATSHNYNQEIANRVYAESLLFLQDVKKLMEVLRSAN